MNDGTRYFKQISTGRFYRILETGVIEYRSSCVGWIKSLDFDGTTELPADQFNELVFNIEQIDETQFRKAISQL